MAAPLLPGPPVGVAMPVQDELSAPGYVELAVLAEREGYDALLRRRSPAARRWSSSAPWRR